jgi:microcompartment protein CcmL/EutN
MRKTYPALAAIDLTDIPTGLLATDALLKRSPIAFIRAGTITGGRWLALFGGTTAAVEEALAAALERGQEALADHVLLPDVHPDLYAAVHGVRQAAGEGSLLVMETSTVPALLRAVETVLKGTSVRLAELRLADAGLAGKGVAVVRGELADVEAADALARSSLQRHPAAFSSRVVSAPHQATLLQLAHGTAFATARVVELEGEEA